MKSMFEKMQKLQAKYECYWSVEFNFGDDQGKPYQKIRFYCGNWDYESRYFCSLESLEEEIDKLLVETEINLVKRIKQEWLEKEQRLRKQLKDVIYKRKIIEKKDQFKK